MEDRSGGDPARAEATSACAWPWTTSAPATRRWRTCAASRSTSSRSTARSSPGSATASGSSIAGAIVSLAHALGLRTVAEGIEDEEQRRAVLALGCDVGQGFLFARPMPADELTRLLAASS